MSNHETEVPLQEKPDFDERDGQEDTQLFETFAASITQKNELFLR